jgi:hypothetical protein
VDLSNTVDEKEYLEVIGKLEDKHLADVLEKSEEWKLVHKAAKQLRDAAEEQYIYMDHSAPDAKLKAIQCQVTIQFYDNFLKGLLDRYKTLGEEAYGHAREMGMLQSLAHYLKTNF